MKSDVENDVMSVLNIDDCVQLLLAGLKKHEVRARLLQKLEDDGACFSDNLKEKDVCKYLGEGCDKNEIISFPDGESYSKIVPQNRLHINPNCPKRTGRYAQPDAVSVIGERVMMIYEIKVHRFGNDCELFNGVVQLKEYLTLYGHEGTIGVLLILGHLVEDPNPMAWNFLTSMADGNVIIVYANLIAENKLQISILQDGVERHDEIDYGYGVDAGVDGGGCQRPENGRRL